MFTIRVTALVLALLFSSSMEDSVTQTQRSESALERESVSLDCTYETSEQYYYLYWYKQPPRGSLIPLFWQHSGGTKGNEAGERFSVNFEKDKSSISLRITALELGDAATYFCAFSTPSYYSTGGYREKLIFGSGTQVTVEPKNQATSPPSVFVVKSRAPKNDKVAAACLAKGFYPKEVTINMNPGTEVVYNSKEGVLSPDGKYSAVQVVKVGPEEAVKCTVIHASQNFSAEDSPSAPAAPTHLPAASPGFCESSTSSSTAEEPDLEKVNMLSLTVLGLRVLMAKSIAFNVLMTAKLFI